MRAGALHVLLGAVFLTAFSLLALQIAFTRLLSVVLSYHYVFAVVSLAFLGLGAGGIVTHFFLARTGRDSHHRLASVGRYAALAALAIWASVFLIAAFATVDGIRGMIAPYLVVILLPFLSCGVVLATVYRLVPDLSARVYGADLIGAASGSAAVVLILDRLGGIDTGLAIAVCLSLAALLFATSAKMAGSRFPLVAPASVAIASAVLVASLTGLYTPQLPVGSNPEKEIYGALHGPRFGRIIESRWTSFGKTDLVAFREDPSHMDIYIDGTAGTPMYRFTGDIEEPGFPVARLRAEFPGFFPFRFLKEHQKRSALVIGPGGGRDILLAKMAGVEAVTAVEVNRDLIDLVRDHSTYNGGLYDGFPGVDIIGREGRNFLRTQDRNYDLIMLSLPVTNTSRSREGFALTENFLLTAESIGEYLDALTEDGHLIVIAHDEVGILRLLSLARAALGERGIDGIDAMKQIYILGSFPYPVFVLKKSPIEPATVAAMHRAIFRFGYSPTASYFPFVRQAGAVNPALMALAAGRIGFADLERMVAERGFDISAVTDDSPFFYSFETAAPRPVSLVFWSALVAMVLVVLVPLIGRTWFDKSAGQGQARTVVTSPVRPLVTFAMLGAGFMLVEVSLVQMFMLFIGLPVPTLAGVLVSLLTAAGVGSLCSARIDSGRIGLAAGIAALATVALLSVYAFALPHVFDRLLGLPLSGRMAAMSALLAPLGFVMGFPFPLAIRLLKQERAAHRVPWMWGINGVASVAGSAAAVVVALSLGFSEVLLLGALCYLAVVFACLRPAAYATG